ncbi:hypothetical protein MCOR25_000453 [Pyricularia grisea]|uniref:Uncharacterized protein n=1 Tax=Pyricularia grisea TaxID=148305 RepID=A0A6P8AVI2_PYRGI|nr:uncharacterized protein PgNI_08836 [Pyricularia grisea]KAI6382944.1 hypothetical protein MCOR25_000453 [Pyricularia grisea]TLD06205.1 hypothetical protein PgNI_08836 [Pyricularia grisea]
MGYKNGNCINKKSNHAFQQTRTAGNGQAPKPNCCRDSEDEYDSNGHYKGSHHSQLLLTAKTLRDGTAWKGISPGLPSTTASPAAENSRKRHKSNHDSIVPKITVTSPDGLVSYGSWDTPVPMVRLKTSRANARLLHVGWRPARVPEEPGLQSSSLQHEQGQYTLATIDDGIARLVMKKNVDVENKNGHDKLLDYEEYDWDD